MAEVRKKIVEDRYNLNKVKKDSEKTKTKKEVVSKKKEKKEKVIEKKTFLINFVFFAMVLRVNFIKFIGHLKKIWLSIQLLQSFLLSFVRVSFI